MAAQNSHLDCFTYALEKGLPWSAVVPTYLVQNKRLDFLLYAIKHGCPLSASAVDVAVRFGSVDVLHILLYAGCPIPAEACLAATKRKQFECLQLLHQHGAFWDAQVTAAAAAGNHLPSLQYLHEQGCLWDEETTNEAARNGCISTITYAMENGCPYSEDIVAVAASHTSHISCLQYLIEEQGLFVGGEETFLTAIRSCNPAAVQYLIDQGCDIHNDVNETIPPPLYTHWSFDMDQIIVEPFIECIKIAKKYDWDLRKQAPSLFRDLVRELVGYFERDLMRDFVHLFVRGLLRYSSDRPLLYAYFQEEG
eukprot:CAMPEP_0184996112 /NCGR_PEP_ID=MMETSP1098-20130426/55196_1 /TAXON_ID=89044 /ORGANISM="Spumella elongata, Strain CCAP 955/1" /LENGTH=308 /DNA_ID=CAMNT_0027522501 /DNA_START=796 /DNA_END=1719 /DNA_ORIENTATION=+